MKVKIALYLPLVFLCLLFFLFGVVSCQHEPLALMPDPDPDPMGCDTTEVSYAAVIAPLIEQYCYSGCHNGPNPSSGFNLDSYVAVKAKVDEGRLYGAVAQLSGFVPMPLGQDPVPDCEIAQIKAWIDDGAPDN